jgi:hypothetical protein
VEWVGKPSQAAKQLGLSEVSESAGDIVVLSNGAKFINPPARWSTCRNYIDPFAGRWEFLEFASVFMFCGTLLIRFYILYYDATYLRPIDPGDSETYVNLQPIGFYMTQVRTNPSFLLCLP